MRLVSAADLFGRLLASIAPIACVGVMAALGLGSASAQNIDCGQLQQQIAQTGRGGGGNRYAAAARKQASELARTQAYAHQLGCDGFTFFGGNPQCTGLNQHIQQMQANLGALQSAGGGSRNDLVARFNAYCRGGQHPPQPRGFFESLFGGAQEDPHPAPLPPPIDPNAPNPDDDGDGPHAHGGSQAVCVRTCDGGFFPLAISSRHSSDDLTQMCQALCPGTDTAVYTRSPDAEIKTAVGLDGRPYVDLPNALKFQKAFVPQCSCRPAGKSWAEALANADDVLGNLHKGDIVVTPQKSDELSRPKLDAKQRTSLLSKPMAATATPDEVTAADAAVLASPDAAKRAVRQVGPQP